MKRSIAIVTPVFPPYRSGIGKVAEQDAQEIAALGFDVTVYAPGARPGRRGGYAMRNLFGLPKWGNAAFVPGAALIPSRHDAVVLHYPFYGVAEPVALAKFAGGRARLILEYHMDVKGSGAAKGAFAAHARFCMPRIVRQADCVLVTSLDYARNSRVAPLLDAMPERFRELPPAVDVRAFSPGAKPARLLARYGFEADDRILVFVGGLDRAHYFKGVPNLLAALATRPLDRVKAVIVGEGGERAGYEALAKSLGLAGRVVFAGSVSEEDLPDHYRLADVFVFPSVDRSEAFGIAALEALSSGVPVVASDLPGVRTVVRGGETGLLSAPGSVTSLALRLRELTEDDGRRGEMGANGRRVALTEYSTQRRLERWRGVLGELDLL